MLNPLFDFMRGLRSMAWYWQVWVGWLILVNMVAPLAFLQFPEAQWTLAATLAGGMIGLILVKLQGFTRLLGLMHIFWIPLVFYLWIRFPALPKENLIGQWVFVVLVTNTLSLVIDVTDVVRYLAGERESTIENIP